MESQHTFPFGMPVTTISQQDRTSKRVFVLGVYASAVHARWLDTHGVTKVAALAVASEPYIFWRGDDAAAIIAQVPIPPQAGTLVPAAESLNGPSGRALDRLFLQPLGIDRQDAWLCDLVPHSCQNSGQAQAIARAYEPLRDLFSLPQVTVPPVPQPLVTSQRRLEILAELEQAQPQIVVLLGDLPIRWFLAEFVHRWRRLADFGQTQQDYGKLHPIAIGDRTYQVLPLVHPRQAARLGVHASIWADLHDRWMQHVAGTIAQALSLA